MWESVKKMQANYKEEEEEEGEKMQANPAYLPIEMSYNSLERQYLNVMMAPPDTDVAEDHSKMWASPLR